MSLRPTTPRIIFSFFLLASFFISCSKNNRGTITTTVTPLPTTTTTAAVNAGTLSCSGGTDDGYDDLAGGGRTSPILIYQAALGGSAEWYPGAPPFAGDKKAQLSTSDQNDCTAVGDGSSCDRGTSNKCQYCYRPVALSKGNSQSFVRPIILKKDAYCLMANDGPLWMRVKVESPYSFNLNGYPGAYCYGRVANSKNGYSPYAIPYTAMRFNVYALTLQKKATSTCTASCECNSLTSSCTDNCTEDDFEYINGPMGALVSQVVVGANNCSSVIALPSLGLASSKSTQRIVPHIANVEVNSECLESPSMDRCPFLRINTQNCWFATLQIATNNTQFFKGSTR